jgi:hypothetical protein
MQEMDAFNLDIYWPKGVYFLKIVSDDSMKEFRIVKN